MGSARCDLAHPALAAAESPLDDKAIILITISMVAISGAWIMAKRRAKTTRKAHGVRWISAAEATRSGLDAGSKAVKRLAAKQKFRVKLTAPQLEAIRKQLRRWNNANPAEISFLVRGEVKARFRVAGYAYTSDTCCA